MIHLVKKIYTNAGSIVAMLILLSSGTLKADPLTPTELHATLGIVTSFILSDDTNKSVSHNGVTYGTVTSPYTGEVWLDRNLGASQVCTSFDDPLCYGDYYQWGRNADGHEDSMSNTTTTIALNVNNVGHGYFIGTVDWASVDITGTIRSANWSEINGNSVCPIGFRVPTRAEFKVELYDVGSAQIANRNDAFNSFLKLPSAGNRAYFLGAMANVGTAGYVWSVSSATDISYPISFSEFSASSTMQSLRGHGLSVRCIKN